MTIHKAFSWVAAAGATLLLLGSAFPALASTSTGSTFQVQGANIMLDSSTDLGGSSFIQTLKNLRADNANSVTFVIPLLQSSETSTDVNTTWSTPSDSSLAKAIQEAHSLGLAVTLKPHAEISDGAWRANIDPTDRTTWFNNYTNLLKHYAVIAQSNGVEQMVLGTELIDVSSATHNSTNTQNWDTLIANVRTVYSGQLGYASNWGSGAADEMDQIQFWDKLDFIGVDFYYNYASANESVPQMESELQAWNQSDLSILQQRYNKPVEFTETGYRSVQNANLQPWDWQISGPVDDIDQANAYEALFSYWSTVSFIKGTSIWEWNSNPNSGGPSDTDYTPQGKPAEAILSAWYGGNGSSVAVPKPLTATAALSATSTTPGTAVTISTQVNNPNAYSQTNNLIDTEIYNASGSKVFQQFASGQTLPSNQTSTYNYSWTPSTTGTYTVKVGVFTNDWSQNYVWNNSATVLLVQNQVVTPPVTTPPQAGMLSATAANVNTTVNSPTTITAQVSNGAGSLSNALVDTEVYDANGAKVFQNFTSNQSFATGDVKQYQSTYTPSAPGTYRIALGIFANDWSKNFFWINQAGTITVAAAGTTPTQPPATTTPPVATTTPPVTPPAPPVATSTPPVATSTPPVATSTPPVITPPPSNPPTNTGVISGSTSARLGTSVNFGGTNFGHEENVTITVNGQTLSNTPHADGGGNFSTGSMSVPLAAGTYTYTFTGQHSGIVGTATVQITP